MLLLNKRHSILGNSNKYYIDCNSIDPSSIQSVEILKHTPLSKRNSFDTIILHSIANNELIQKKNRHIVVKIGRTKSGNEYMAEKEFAIGKQLYGINGFIKFLCIFSCNDDTSKYIKNETQTDRPICTSDNNNDKKFVLVMPYIHKGSLLDYDWSADTIPMLKSLVIHTIFSLTEAFIKIGFIHGDLHWGNILFKKTTKSKLVYDIGDKQISFLTPGYKVVIMDFEKSQTNNQQNDLFWCNLKLFLKFDKMTEDKKFISWENDKIVSFLQRMAESNQSPAKKIDQLVQMIEDSTFNIIQTKQTKYDPNNLF